MLAGQDLAFFIAFGLFTAAAVGFVVYSVYTSRKDIAQDGRNMRQEWRAFRADAGKLRNAYRRERQGGSSSAEALTAAAEDIDGTRLRPTTPAAQPPQPSSNGAAAVTYGLLVNAVSIVGVYLIKWPIATGLALYWAENVLTGTLLVVAIGLWRAGRSPVTDGPRGPVAGEVAMITAAFNGVHLVFLVLVLGFILPRVDPSQSFDPRSFLQGLALVAALLALEFGPGIARVRRASAVELQAGVTAYIQRVGVVHLAILLGMVAVAVTGRARAFFAVFSALKTIVDVSRRVAR